MKKYIIIPILFLISVDSISQKTGHSGINMRVRDSALIFITQEYSTGQPNQGRPEINILKPLYRERDLALITLQRDTITLASFVAGARFVSDTAAFTDSTLYGAFYNDGSDTLVITGLRGVMNGGTSDTLGIQLWYNDSINVVGTAFLTSTLPLNSTSTGNAATATNFVGSTNVKIPPGNWVWMKSPTVVTGRKPWFLSVSLFGYKARR